MTAQTVKNLLPVMQETWVQSLGQEDALEKGMATHSSILDWKTLWTEEPGGLQSNSSQKKNSPHPGCHITQNRVLCTILTGYPF